MAITFGLAGSPSQKTVNFDALFTASLANHSKTLADNISTSNALFFMVKKMGGYQSEDGGTHIEIPLMHALGAADTYDGYDPLNTDPTEGLTKVLFEWRQAAVPVTISFKEERQNAQKIFSLVETKIEQADLGLQDFFGQILLRGGKAAGGVATIEGPRTSPFNGSKSIEPLPLLIKKDPTVGVVGNIDPAVHTFWQNQQKASVATTSTAFLQEMESIYNDCSKGPGGPPDLIIADQLSFELAKFALYHRARHEPSSDSNFPFVNVIYQNARLVWDEFMPDVTNDTLTPSTGKGAMFFTNSKFWKIKYDRLGNFRNTPFVRPANQDARVSHIVWMGNTTINNRRKHGVLHGIDRTLTLGDA